MIPEDPIQCQEISSTTPEVYEGPQHGDILDRLRSLVQKVCSAARKKNVTFHSIEDENYRIVVDEEPIELIHDEEKNDTLLRFSWRDFSMEKMDGLISVTFVLYYVVTEFGNNVDIFDVNAFGVEEILAERLRVQELNLSSCLSSGNADEVMEYWGPKIQYARLLRFGTVVDQQSEETCERIYEKWFKRGCLGFYADNINVSFANRLRRQLRIAMFSSDSIPVEVVVKWIKGWIMSVPGYNHLALVDFSIPEVRILPGVLWQFGIDACKIPPNAVIQTRNRSGEISFIHINAHGQLYFGGKNIYPEEPIYEIDLVFPLDELEDVDTDEEEVEDEEVEDEKDEEMEDEEYEETEDEEEMDTQDEDNQQENHQIA
ncbi:unnamed protein product [Caenorhabditis nigoni]